MLIVTTHLISFLHMDKIILCIFMIYPQDLKDFFRRVAEVTFADAHRFQSGEGLVFVLLD